MAEAIRRNEWDQTAMICKTIADVNRAAGSAPVPMQAFQPMYWGPVEIAPAREVVKSLSGVFKGLRGMRGEP